MKLNNLSLKAIRQGLGLTVAEAAELPSINVTKRTFQYWESGKVPLPTDVDLVFFGIVSHRNLVLEQMLADVERVTVHQDPEIVGPTIKPILPFYKEFADFSAATKCDKVVYWRIYQAVVSDLVMSGKIKNLDDNAAIPKDFKIWNWLSGAYELGL